MRVKGRVRVDRRTKTLVQRLQPNEIAVIDHPDLDPVAAQALLRRRPRAVINASPSLTGRYPHAGPLVLMSAGIPLLDAVGQDVLGAVREGDEVEIEGEALYCRGEKVAAGRLLDNQMVASILAEARDNFPRETAEFIQNTLHYALAEVQDILQGLDIPPLSVDLQGRQVLVVVRGEHCREDLRAVRTYIQENHPVLVGVDGGADALLDCGYRPQIIVGDMDSVSDRALMCGAELVVHAYPDGRAPGAARLETLNLRGHVLRAPGTSEDVALLMAHQLGAELIVILGSHFSVLDFLNKGRRGMASTLLARLKVGSILLDGKGVSLLYREKFRLRALVELVGAALLSALLLLLATPVTQQLLRLAALRLRLAWGF